MISRLGSIVAATTYDIFVGLYVSMRKPAVSPATRLVHKLGGQMPVVDGVEDLAWSHTVARFKDLEIRKFYT